MNGNSLTNIYDFVAAILERGLRIGDMQISLGSSVVNVAADHAVPKKRGRPAKPQGPGKVAAKTASKTPKRGKPIDAERVMSALQKLRGPVDRLQLSRKLRVPFQRLIRLLPSMAARGEIRALPGELFEAMPAADMATAQ